MQTRAHFKCVVAHCDFQHGLFCSMLWSPPPFVGNMRMFHSYLNLPYLRSFNLVYRMSATERWLSCRRTRVVVDKLQCLCCNDHSSDEDDDDDGLWVQTGVTMENAFRTTHLFLSVSVRPPACNITFTTHHVVLWFAMYVWPIFVCGFNVNEWISCQGKARGSFLLLNYHTTCLMMMVNGDDHMDHLKL